MLFAAITAITFTSCDKDDMISYDLKGTWKGDMYQVSEYGGKRYNASYTELYFETSAFRTARGIGKWIDHYSNNPYYDYFASNIDWQVKDQIIYITFKNGDRTTLEIRNYDIDRDRFYGERDRGRDGNDADASADCARRHEYGRDSQRADGTRDSARAERSDRGADGKTGQPDRCSHRASDRGDGSSDRDHRLSDGGHR